MIGNSARASATLESKARNECCTQANAARGDNGRSRDRPKFDSNEGRARRATDRAGLARLRGAARRTAQGRAIYGSSPVDLANQATTSSSPSFDELGRHEARFDSNGLSGTRHREEPAGPPKAGRMTGSATKRSRAPVVRRDCCRPRASVLRRAELTPAAARRATAGRFARNDEHLAHRGAGSYR